jgi:DNA-binding NarL/FixJ family response regulator
MKNSDLLSRMESVRPKETESTDDFGKKITKRDGDANMYKLYQDALAAHQAKNKPTQQSAPTGGGTVDLNNLTPAQLELAKRLKAQGSTKEEIAATLNKIGE